MGMEVRLPFCCLRWQSLGEVLVSLTISSSAQQAEEQRLLPWVASTTLGDIYCTG